MFKKSKFVFVALAGLLLAGCGGSEVTTSDTGSKDATNKRISLTVWSSLEDLTLQEELAAEFAEDYAYDPETNTNYKFNFYFGDVYVDAQKLITQDITTAADVFVLPDDQIQVLKTAGALAPFRGAFADDIQENYVASAVSSATLDGEIYGYPYTADNGYFLYYNSNYLTAEDVASMDAMMTKLDSIDKKFVMDLKNGWYLPSFFSSTGTLTYDTVTKIQVCDYDNAEGMNNARGFNKLVVDHLVGSESILSSGLTGEIAGFQTKDESGNPVEPTVVAGVSGTWDAAALKVAMGDGYAAAKLPTFTPIDEAGAALEQRQMGSFAGAKVMAVKIQEDAEKLFFAQLLAQYMNSADAQVRRYIDRNYGPANLASLESEEVQADLALQALAAQAPFAMVQSRAVGGTFWDPMAAFGTAVVEQDFGVDGTLATALQEAVAAIVG